MSRQVLWRVVAVAAIVCAAGSSAARAQDNAEPRGARDLYQDARTAAQSGDIENAEELLRAAVRAGFRDFSVMQRDAALAPLRGRAVLRAILAARDAADDALAQRRIDEWMRTLGPSGYTSTGDRGRKIDLLARRSAGLSGAQALEAVGVMVDDLACDLFPGGLRHRILSIILDEGDASVFLPHPNAHGKYLHAQRVILAADTGRALRHELAHALHHAHMDELGQEHPMWVQEGLASLLESMIPATGHDSAGGEHSFEVESNERDAIIEMMLERGSVMTWQDFFGVSAEVFNRDPGSNYAQARSICRYLNDEGLLLEWYARFCASFDEDSTGGLALEAVFAQPLDEIERRWREWVAAQQRGSGVVVVRAATNEAAAGATREVDQPRESSPDATDALYERARPRLLHEYRGAIAPLRQIVAADPDHAAARYDLGLALIFIGDYEGAEAQRDALDRLDHNLASLLGSAMRIR